MSVIGSIEFRVGLDGKTVPVKAEVLGEEAGIIAREAFNDEFSSFGKDFARAMRSNGSLAGSNFTSSLQSSIRGRVDNISRELADAFADPKGLDEAAKRYGGVTNAVDVLTQKMGVLRGANLLSDKTFTDMGGHLGEWADEAKLAEAEGQKLIALNLNTHLNEVAKAQDEANAKMAASEDVQKRLRVEQDKLTASTKAWMARLKEVKEVTSSDNDTFIEYFRTIGGGHEGISRMSTDLDELHRRGDVSGTTFLKMRRSLSELTNAFDDGGDSVDRFGQSLGDASEDGSIWDNLSFNAKQVIAWSAAIASVAGEIAVLGSVAASSLVTAATVLGALVAGAVVGVVALHNVLNPLASLPESIRGTAGAIQDLVKGFKDMAQPIQDVVLNGLQGPIENLTNTLLPALQTGLLSVAGGVNTAFKEIAANFAAPQQVRDLQTLLEGFSPIIEDIVDAVDHFANGFDAIFIAALPSAQLFAKFLDTLAKKFDTFFHSADGQKALGNFFGTLASLAGPLVDLIGAVGKAIAGMVTPTAISNLQNLIQGLINFLPTITTLVNALTQLGIVNILVDAFKILSDVLDPLMPLLTTFLKWIGDLITFITPVIQIIIDFAQIALAPLISAFNILIDANDRLMTAMQPIIDALQDVFAAALDAVTQAFVGPQGATDNFVDTLINDLQPMINNIVDLIENQWVPWWRDHGADAVSKATDAMTALVSWATKYLIPFLTVTLPKDIAIAVKVVNTLIDVWNALTWPIQESIDLLKEFLNLFGIAQAKKPLNLNGAGPLPLRLTASGGLFTGPQQRIIGEAGAEMVVPLQRPLNQIDPAVRNVAAYAQGGGAPGVGGGKQVYVEAGAIVVSGVNDAGQAADVVLDDLVRKVA